MIRALLACAAAVWCVAAVQPPRKPGSGTPGVGVPQPLAEARARRIGNLRYDLRFAIPADAQAAVAAQVTLRFTLADASQPLALDFSAGTPKGARARGRVIQLADVPDHLIVRSEDLREGANEITIDFDAGSASLNRNPDVMYTLFVPARARLAFPCFDQPDLKAKYTLVLEIPKDWEALANGAESERQVSGDRMTLRFTETAPLPTYLFAFAAGKFEIETAERNGRTFRMFHRETDTAKVARNREAIFDLHAASLAWLERYTGITYPFGKFDFLLVPSFQFGGMEHAGAIFYNASGLLLDQSATRNQELGRASVIAHETAHIWFGDLVTMRWFDDVWMKEVFANFMAAKIVNPSFPGINHDLRFLLSYYPAAYEVDRTPGTNAIRQRLDNLSEAGTLYGAIIYQKAPIVMRQLEMILGEERFRDGLREYLGRYAFANATWPDLIRMLDARTPDDLAGWSRAWVEQAGRPDITTTLRVADGRIALLAFDQKDPVARRGLVWNERIEVALGYDTGIDRIPVHLNKAHLEVTAARGRRAPDFVMPAGGGIGYGGFALDPVSRSYLLHHLADTPDALTRGSAAVTLWEEMLDGRVPPGEVVEVLVESLARERDELNLQRMLSYTQQGYWRFLSAAAREALAPRLERVLRGGLDAAASPSLKSAWFSALRDTAQTPGGVQWLERIWRRTELVPGLVLAEPDFITLAQELAVRVLPTGQATEAASRAERDRVAEILDLQLARTENPDRKARFAFVRPALSPDQGVRDTFFDRLADAENRRRRPAKPFASSARCAA